MDFYERQELTNQEKEKKNQKDINLEEELNEQREKQEKIGVDNEKNRGLASLKDLPTLGDGLSAYTEIDISKDWGFFVAFLISIVADFFSLLPILSGFFGIFFSIILFVIYFLSGQLRNRTVAKVIIALLGDILESIGGFFFISWLPFFTLSAVLIYWLELSYRKSQKYKEQE